MLLLARLRRVVGHDEVQEVLVRDEAVRRVAAGLAQAAWSSCQSRAMSGGGQVGRGIQPSALTVRALTDSTNFGTSGDFGSASCEPPPIQSSGRCAVRGSMNTSSTS